ncbi:RcnB family protein [Aminobacter aganoensis]|uniref:Ni/Co efflux regulator RcnB n=1 Tax=Aminobacter aganoensis TaxID=83264 RepID=A0A7X0KIM7_9HYPH|nr:MULTISPECIES: RcnB family protein [Aminobacter]KQU76148.1 hypothetical protein ASC75_00490 [Aminobacter sp. DSM 101952]MBB6352752.1 Ni/Co efflux regulator RcnB [Aminobacter aganoensis]
MKRIVLAAVALSMFAVPMAQAQQRYEAPRHGNYYSQQQKWQDYRKKPAKRHYWSRGKRVPDWQRKQALRDYHRYGLKRPGHGQRWVKVDNDFLLISVASGIIAAVVASR